MACGSCGKSPTSRSSVPVGSRRPRLARLGETKDTKSVAKAPAKK